MSHTLCSLIISSQSYSQTPTALLLFFRVIFPKFPKKVFPKAGRFHFQKKWQLKPKNIQRSITDTFINLQIEQRL